MSCPLHDSLSIALRRIFKRFWVIRPLRLFFLLSFTLGSIASAQSVAPSTQLSQLVSAVRAKAAALESGPAMRRDFQAFLAAHNLQQSSIRYSDYVLVRLLFEATRDAGLWNMHWTITDQPPNSDRIWHQWRGVRKPSFITPTAIAECDELSALYAFLVGRTGVKGVGLFWPYPNHTVAVWTLHPREGSAVRVVVPTSQIFLTGTDTFDTRKFDPWRQKTIYEYTRHDVPDSFALSRPLYDFFLQQIDKYAGASQTTLQNIRNLRDAVFTGTLSPEQAAREASRQRASLSSVSAPPDDLAALRHFADDMRTSLTQ